MDQDVGAGLVDLLPADRRDGPLMRRVDVGEEGHSASRRPEFLRHRRFSDGLAARHSETYSLFDPFYAVWRHERRAGILPLRSLADAELRRGRHVAEFLAQSKIRDEVGVPPEDGGDRCLGIFLDRSTKFFRESEIALLRERLPVFSALRALDLRARRPEAVRAGSRPAIPARSPQVPPDLWPSLSPRERELVQLIPAGHPTASITARPGIAAGTVKNHRRRIYEKLDITTERELFPDYFAHAGGGEGCAEARNRRAMTPRSAPPAAVEPFWHGFSGQARE